MNFLKKPYLYYENSSDPEGNIIYVCRTACVREISFEEWLTKLRYADWSTPADIFSTFPTADLLGNGSQRVVFDIGGNKYRMICKYAFGDQLVHLFVCWIGTHAAYSRLCHTEKQYTVSDY